MICTSCNTEVEGIRLNGKIFCPNCGVSLGEVEKTMADYEASLNGAYTAEENPNESGESADRLIAESLEVDLGLKDKDEQLVSSSWVSQTEPVQKIISPNEDAATSLAPETEELPISDVNNRLEEINKLEAEEEVLELIESLPESTQSIQKNERARTDHRNGEGFILIANEPDPIEEPELPSPVDMLVEESESLPVKTKEYDVIQANERDWEEKTFLEKNKSEPAELSEQQNEPTEQEIAESNNPKTTFFTDYLKNSVQNIKAPEQKRKPVKKISKNYIFITIALIVFILIFTGLLFYVNLYAFNPNTSIKQARTVSGISFQMPETIPEGYLLSRKTSGEEGRVNIVYEFVNDRTKTITIEIKTLDFKEEELFEKIIGPSGQEYLNFQSNGSSYWYLGGNKIVFAKSDLVYQITSSAKMSKEELLKIAEGVVFGNDLSG